MIWEHPPKPHVPPQSCVEQQRLAVQSWSGEGVTTPGSSRGRAGPAGRNRRKTPLMHRDLFSTEIGPEMEWVGYF